MSVPAQPVRGAWYALLLVALTNALSLLDRNILAILAPRIKRDLGVGDAEMGLLYGTVFALFYALFSLPLGRLADSWIRTRLLAITLGFWSIATGLAAGAQGFALLALSRLGVGIGEGAAQPAGFSIAYDLFPRERRGMIMAVIAAAIAIGLGGSSVLGGVAADWWDGLYAGRAAPLGLHGWQFAFALAAAPGLLVALLLWRLPEPVRGRMDGIEASGLARPAHASLAVLAAVLPGLNWIMLARRRAPASMWLVNLAGAALISAAMLGLAHVTAALSPRPALHLGGFTIGPHALQWSVIGCGLFVVLNLLQSLRLTDRPAYAVLATSPSMLLCFAVGGLQTMINYGIMGFTPSFLMQSYGLSPAKTGLQFGLLSAALGIVGPLIAGPLSDRMNARFPGSGRILVTLFALGVSPLIALWVYAAADATSFYLRFVLYSLVLTAWLPPLYAILFGLALPRMRGITASTYIIVQTIFGLGVGPFVVGMISDANGGHLGSAILAINWVAPLIVLLLVLLALRVRRDEASLLARAHDAGEPLLAQPAAA